MSSSGRYQTEHEAFWAGSFGDEYIARNDGAPHIASSLALFSRILSSTQRIDSVLEVGANIGLNLQALRQLLPSANLSAVEINAQAATRLRAIPGVEVHNASLLDYQSAHTHDLTLAMGVLIHIAPDRLPDAYERLYAASRRYVCLVEYYNPVPVALPYRGHAERLYKRDFAGEMLDRYPDLRLVAYGFRYHRDPLFPMDDTNWFLLERQV